MNFLPSGCFGLTAGCPLIAQNHINEASKFKNWMINDHPMDPLKNRRITPSREVKCQCCSHAPKNLRSWIVGETVPGVRQSSDVREADVRRYSSDARSEAELTKGSRVKQQWMAIRSASTISRELRGNSCQKFLDWILRILSANSC